MLKNINEIKLTYSEKRYEMPSFKKEVLSNVYEMRPYLIVYVFAWPMIGYLPYTGKFSYPGADILTFFCLTIQSLHGDSDKQYFDNKHFLAMTWVIKLVIYF